MTAKIACAEKALVDLIHFRTDRYVVDLVIEKLQTYQNELDIQKLVEYIGLASQKTVKIFGFMFDLIGLNSGELSHCLSKRRSTHWISANDQTFNAKWRLYYDDYFDQYQVKKED